MTTTKASAAPALPPAPHRPKLIVAIGRQRVGKTTLLKALVEIAREQGGDPEVWNTDGMNKSHAITSLGKDVKVAPFNDKTDAQASWLEERIGELAMNGRDAVLDIGGGWTAIHELFRASPLLGVLDQVGIDLVPLFVVGAERADLDYLADMSARGFEPPRTAVILNEGLIPVGTETGDAATAIISHKAVKKAFHNEGTFAVFPALNGIHKITDREQTFTDYIRGLDVEGQPKISVFDRFRVDFWLRRLVPQFVHEIGTDYLPHMPKGLPVIEAKEAFNKARAA